MADILSAKENLKRALHDIEDLKIHEDDYGKINKLQNILNSFMFLTDTVNKLIVKNAKLTGQDEDAIVKEILA